MKITLTELLRMLADRQRIHDLLIERAVLKQQILELVADDAAKLAKAKELYEKTEIVEAKMRAGLPQTAP